MAMTSSAQFEQESERTRAHLNDTVSELRSRMTVGQVADQVWDLAKDGLGGDFARNLARQAANNPMPVALMGTGLAWLMFAKSDGNRRSHGSAEYIDRGSRATAGLGVTEEETTTTRGSGHTLRRMAKPVRRTAHDMRDAAAAAGTTIADGYESVSESASGMASSAYDAAKDGMDSAKETASSAYEAIKERAAAAGDKAASTYGSMKETIKERTMQTRDMATDSAKAVSEYATGSAQRIADFCADNPLVLIGAGLALGAIAGAILPVTEMENELMGETSDQLKQQAEHIAASQVDKVERVGEQIIDHASESAAREFGAGDTAAGSTGLERTDQYGNTAAP
jgi:ElaB/YqjD/DUF883 family membrane-anchored ribosome-binding protein